MENMIVLYHAQVTLNFSVLKSTILLDVMLCSPEDVNQHFLEEHAATFFRSKNKPSKKPAIGQMLTPKMLVELYYSITYQKVELFHSPSENLKSSIYI
jgi:hypothetical protein